MIESNRTLNQINLTNLNKILNDTIKFVDKNSLRNFHCKCNSITNDESSSFNSATSSSSAKRHDPYLSSSSASSASSVSSHNNNNYVIYQQKSANTHKPSVEFLIKCTNMFQELFEVPCFSNIPTKLNDVYYKLGQLTNFRNAIQNVFAPGSHIFNYKSIEVFSHFNKLKF